MRHPRPMRDALAVGLSRGIVLQQPVQERPDLIENEKMRGLGEIDRDLMIMRASKPPRNFPEKRHAKPFTYRAGTKLKWSTFKKMARRRV